MRSLLTIGCILFLVILSYGFIQGVNYKQHHKYTCKTIFIPEDIDIETAFESVNTTNIHKLRKRARSLGASKDQVEAMSLMELKVYIIQMSVSEEHIVTQQVEQEIMDREESTVTSQDDVVASVDPLVPPGLPQIQAMQDDFE
tara:strand:+ start:1546 stop:1974 length:429 start_codon:yes stop_codon:yes gene_type:complete